MKKRQARPDDIDVDAIDERFVVRFRPTVAAVELDGEAVLLDGDTGAVHTLNPTATLVWKFCDGTTSLSELVADLVVVFDDVDPEVVRTDVLELARTLGRQGVLEGVRAQEPISSDGHVPHVHDHDGHGDRPPEDVDVSD